VTHLPSGFTAHVANVGVKDDSDDFVVIAARQPVAAAGMFTRSRFAGPSVAISRRNVADGTAQAVVVISKNANVATGPDGQADAEAVVAAVAARLGCDAGDVLIASTGVIGRRYPLERILAGVEAMPSPPTGTSAVAVAVGMMTTDTVPKVAAATVGAGPAQVVGMAKGVGMIEPDMATMIAVLLTDGAVDAVELDGRFRQVVERTLNCLSIDTDTSTSDTALVLASGEAGEVDGEDLEQALGVVAESLAKQLARDGEGAEKVIEVVVDGARDRAQAKRVAKAIVNSPLVKTAVHGADPNWGRVAMAIGKCQDDLDIEQERVVIRFGDQEVYPTVVDDDARLAELSSYLAGYEVVIHVTLGTGDASCTVWGCDLTAGYVHINADYTT
jgi:glutamate N-acetyltransferase/amino-acid N-acetyltransferase